MYKAKQVAPDAWRVFYIEEGRPPVIADGRSEPYPHKTHAYRAARRLNKVLEPINKMIAEKGAIIL